MLAAKRSIRTFASGNPRAFSASTTDCIIPFGPQTNTASTSSSSTQCESSAAARSLVDAAMQQRNVLRLARQHVDEVESLEIAVLDRRELLLEHHGAGRAIAVEERELARRLRGERRLHDRQERRDSAPGREADVTPAARAVRGTLKWPSGGVTLERVPRLDRVVGPVGEHAAGVPLDRDAEHAVLHRRANRVRAAHVLPVDVGPQREVLARLVTEQRSRDRRGPPA